MWWKCESGFSRHRKVIDCLSEDEGATALLWWWFAGLWSVEQLSDGRIPRRVWRVLLPTDTGVSCDRAAEILVRVGLLDPTDDGWQIHDFLDWQPSARTVRKALKQRAEAGRRGGINRWKQTSSESPSESPSESSRQNTSAPSRLRSDPTRHRSDTDTDPKSEGLHPLSPVAAEPAETPPVAAPSAPRANSGGRWVALWVSLMREHRGVANPTVAAKDAVALNRWAKTRPDADVEHAIRSLVADDDPWVASHGWSAWLVPRRADAYLAKRAADKAPQRDYGGWEGRLTGADLDAFLRGERKGGQDGRS